MKYFDSNKPVEGNKLVYVMPDNEGKFVVLYCVVHGYIDIADVVYLPSFDEAVLMEGINKFSNESDIVFESSRDFFHIGQGLREHYDVRIVRKKGDQTMRILSQEGFIKSKVRFRSDYESCPQYLEFMDDVLDYSGDGACAAMNALASLSSYSARRYEFT
ncbi:hypothetical protein NXY07_26300 [Phocaeicola dorei]|nr:hypothetical protein [Phocaeicola dorei]